MKIIEPTISNTKNLRFMIKVAITLSRMNNRITLNDTKGLAQQ